MNSTNEIIDVENDATDEKIEVIEEEEFDHMLSNINGYVLDEPVENEKSDSAYNINSFNSIIKIVHETMNDMIENVANKSSTKYLINKKTCGNKIIAKVRPSFIIFFTFSCTSWGLVNFVNQLFHDCGFKLILSSNINNDKIEILSYIMGSIVGRKNHLDVASYLCANCRLLIRFLIEYSKKRWQP